MKKPPHPARRLLLATLATLQTLTLLAGLAAPGARAEVTVSNLTVAQTPGTKQVVISYDVANTATSAVSVSLTVKNGATLIPTPSLTGDVGASVQTGSRRTIVWNGGADADGQLLQNVEVAVNAVSAAALASTYLVIDLSGGTAATSYPVSYLSAVPAGGWTAEHKTTKLVLRRIPAGTFTMGGRSTDYPGATDDGLHEVTLTKDFYLGVFEVTQRQWELVMGNKPSYFNNATYYAARPVEQVSYYDIRENPANSDDPASDWPTNSTVNATSFMGKLRTKTGLASFDLPTEAQWEYACRAGRTTALNSGKNLTSTSTDANMAEVGRYFYNGGYVGGTTAPAQNCTTANGTAAAGAYLPNAWGLYDMHGNVFEWCLDWSGTYPSAVVIDPVGVTSGGSRVLRGASWIYDASYCRSAYRASDTPSVHSKYFGLRVCSAPPGQ
jgi:formylglycine-generating enzyme required for sulfatase activity